MIFDPYTIRIYVKDGNLKGVRLIEDELDGQRHRLSS